eukprot:670755-Amphidinium_carterae.1
MPKYGSKSIFFSNFGTLFHFSRISAFWKFLPGGWGPNTYHCKARLPMVRLLITYCTWDIRKQVSRKGMQDICRVCLLGGAKQGDLTCALPTYRTSCPLHFCSSFWGVSPRVPPCHSDLINAHMQTADAL